MDNNQIPDYIKEAAETYANGFYTIRDYDSYESDYDYRTVCEKHARVQEHFIAGYHAAARYHQSPVAIEQDLKELDASFDYLCKMDGIKDAGHKWIEFTDKWNAFKRKLARQSPVAERDERMVWVKASVLPEIIGRKAMPKHVRYMKKRWKGEPYRAKAVAYYFPEHFKSVEWEDWDDYDEKDFPYTENDTDAGIVWLRPGWYSSVDCEKCDGYWSAPLDVVEWLDETPSHEGKDADYWKQRCLAAEDVIDCLELTEDFYLLHKESYDKWQSLKQKQ